MIGYTSYELIWSVAHALIYGAFFAFVYQLALILRGLIVSIPSLLCEVVFYEEFFVPPRLKDHIEGGKTGSLFAFFSLLSYFLGFILLSYYSLDGQIRLYMLAITSASLYIFNISFCVVLRAVITFLLDVLLVVVAITVRIILLPIKIIYNILVKNPLNI